MVETKNKNPNVAYFCMEFGLDKNLRIYAGGLGVLAGDILKTANETYYPIIGIGLLWKKGYTKQLIGDNNFPYDAYPTYEDIYDELEDTGVTIEVPIKEQTVFAKVWKLTGYGNTPLYLLDTNLPQNNKDQMVTDKLYIGSREKRISQEILLGIGGVKAIRELDLNIDVFHFNEGHAVLAGTELIKEKMKKGVEFDRAWEQTRKEIVFTTHTPVKEGNEAHSLELLGELNAFNGLTYDQMKKIGGDPFNMTVAGLRLSRAANAVSQLHGKTAEKMWGEVDNRAPIKAITNGINRKTWVDHTIISNYDDSEKLWKLHQQHKDELIRYIKIKNAVSLRKDRLTIGFARRAATYKRPDLIFRKPEIIGEYLENNKIQLIFSGKAHPEDNSGKEMVAHLIHMSHKYPESVVFIEDYDIEVAKLMTKGVDIWLNNPRRPQEASGTSGMKAAMNGVLNLSILDGWWPEVCEHGKNGWQFGDGYVGEGQDEHDLDSLYKVLLKEVVPVYYEDKERWIKMMQSSIDSTYQQFSARRMLNEYYQKLYR
ncbi:MAG: alpha-glucan family phosphorylase [Halanaerobiales bacterium]